MGTIYCHAMVGTGVDNRIVMEYSYHPDKAKVGSWQIVFALVVLVVGIVWWRKRGKDKSQI